MKNLTTRLAVRAVLTLALQTTARAGDLTIDTTGRAVLTVTCHDMGNNWMEYGSVCHVDPADRLTATYEGDPDTWPGPQRAAPAGSYGWSGQGVCTTHPEWRGCHR